MKEDLSPLSFQRLRGNARRVEGGLISEQCGLGHVTEEIRQEEGRKARSELVERDKKPALN